MLHARHNLLSDEAALVEIDAGEPIEHRLMGKGIAESVVAPALGHAEGDAVRVILILSGERAAEIADARTSWKQDAMPERRKARIGIGDGAVGKPGRRAPGRGYGEGRILGDLDWGTELVEAEPLRELAGLSLGQFEEKAVTCRHDKKIEKNFPLRREQAGMDGAARLRLVDIVGDQPLQKGVGGRPRDPHDRTVGKKRRVALAHGHALETYSGGRKPASSSESLILPETFDLLIKGATLVNHAGEGLADIGVKDGRIVAIGGFAGTSAGRTIEAGGMHIQPGDIDTQVHFREPGLEHKEDLQSGSRSAVLGGVTAVFEMPNTRPATVSAEALAQKVARGRGRMYCDFAFFVGATRENVEELPRLEKLPGAAGVKVFMGSSTGDLLVDDEETLSRILALIERRAAFHAEDEARLRERASLRRDGDPASHSEWRDPEAALAATAKLLRLAIAAGKRVHVLHVSTAAEMQLLALHKDVASVEVTPQHLTLAAPEVYRRLGTKAQMNPPLRDAAHQNVLWWGLTQGVVDVLGSDHAPHTLEEKAQSYPASPSGMPGVQTLVPVMLNHVNKGRLSLARFVNLTSAGPQRLFGIAGKGRIAVGYDADLTIVDLKAERVIEEDWIGSKCGWTPFAGEKVKGWPVGTIVRGNLAMWEGELGTACGEPVSFGEALPRDPLA
jgi:dihydroorotase